MTDRVEAGHPVQKLMEFGKLAGITTDGLAKLIHTPAPHLRPPCRRHRLAEHPRGRARRAADAPDAPAKPLFVTHENTRQRLNRELPALRWRIPLNLARIEQGARAVENLVGQIQRGIVT